MGIADTSPSSPTSRPRASASVPPTAHDGGLPRRVVLAFLLLSSLGAGVVLSILGPSVPAIAVRLGVSEAALGLVFTANFLAATVTTVASGALVDNFGSRILIPAGLATMALGLLGEGLANSLLLIVLASVVAGAGTGVINVSVSAAGARLYPARRDATLTWLNVLFGVGAFLTPLAVGLSLGRFGGYTPAYAVGAVVLAVPILPLLLGLPARIARDALAPVKPALLSLLRDRNLRLLMALGGLYLGAEIGFGGWVISVVAGMTHLPAANLAPVASAFWLCLAAGGAPTTLLLHRGVPARSLMMVGSLAAAGGAVLLLLTGASLPLAIVCCALIGLAFAPILPLATSLAAGQGIADGSDGARIAAVFLAGQVGAAAIPAVQGALLSLGAAPALGLTTVCCLAMAGLAAMTVARSTAHSAAA